MNERDRSILLKIPEGWVEFIDLIKDRMGTEDRSEVIKASLAMMDWALKARGRGEQIVSLYENDIVEHLDLTGYLPNFDETTKE